MLANVGLVENRPIRYHPRHEVVCIDRHTFVTDLRSLKTVRSK